MTAGLSGQPRVKDDIVTKWCLPHLWGECRGGTFCDTGISFASLELVSRGETADSGACRHGWSRCSENRSLMTHGNKPKPKQNKTELNAARSSESAASGKLHFTRTPERKQSAWICLELWQGCRTHMPGWWSLPLAFIFLSIQVVYYFSLSRVHSHALKSLWVSCSFPEQPSWYDSFFTPSGREQNEVKDDVSLSDSLYADAEMTLARLVHTTLISMKPPVSVILGKSVWYCHFVIKEYFTLFWIASLLIGVFCYSQ